MPRINELPDGEEIQDGDLFVVSQSGLARKISWAEIFAKFNIGFGGSAGQDVPDGMIKGVSGSFVTGVPAVDYPGLATHNTFTLPQTLPVIDKAGQVFNVKAYGAIGDGVTDDTAAIQAAITAAQSAPLGGAVFVPPGKYVCTRQILISNHSQIVPIALCGSPGFNSRLDFPGNHNRVVSAKLLGGVVTLTFFDTHPFVAGQLITVGGMTNPSYNGNYTVSSSPAVTANTLSYPLAHADISSAAVLGYVNQRVSAVSVTSGIVTLTFSQPHGLLANDYILVRGMTVALSVDYLNGTFKILSVGSTTLTYNLSRWGVTPPADVAETSDTGTVELSQGVRLEDATTCSVRDLYITGHINSPFGLNVSDFTEQVSISHVYGYDFQNCIAVGGDTPNDVSEVALYQCIGVSVNGVGFLFGNGISANVLDIQCYGCSGRNSKIGVQINGGGVIWMGGCNLGNSVADFSQTQISSHPVVIDGVRSENSKRFWDATDQGASPFLVGLRNISVPNFHDPGGFVVSHNSAVPLYMENCSFYGGDAPVQLRLGFDLAHPLRCVMTNVVVDNDTPIYNHGSHLDLSVIGLYKLVGGSLTTAAPVTTYSKYFDGPVNLPVIDSGGQVFNVKAYGAIGDGTHDDTGAIQAAIAAAPSGSVIYFPHGHYKVTSSLVIAKPLTLSGSGMATYYQGAFGDVSYGLSTEPGSVIETAMTSGNLIDFSTITSPEPFINLKISDLQLKGLGDASRTTVGLNLGSLTLGGYCVLERVGITNFKTGLSLLNMQDSVMNDLWVLGCDVGVYLGTGTTANTFVSLNTGGCGDAVFFDGGAKCVILGGAIQSSVRTGVLVNGEENSLRDIYFESASSPFAIDIQVGGPCTFIDSCHYGGWPGMDGVRINASACRIINTHYGQLLTIGSLVSSTQIIGNWSGTIDDQGLWTAYLGYQISNPLARGICLIGTHHIQTDFVVPFSATPVFDADAHSAFNITVTGTVTSSTIVMPRAGGILDQMIRITWIQDGTGHSYTWPTNCKFAGAAPTNPGANKRDTVTFRFDGTNWYELYRAAGVG